MAPMLGRKLFPLVNRQTESLEAGDKIYTIKHSNESFTDKEEYEVRLQLYGKQIWTCKSTGSSKLTHKEAWDQEQKVSKLLQEKFQSCFEKPALEIVHHNRLALGQLVEEVFREFMTRYVVDEECNYEDENGQSMRVKIIKVFPPEKANQEPSEKKAESTCDTSSGNKGKTNEMGSDNYGKEPSKEEESGLIESQRDYLSGQALHLPPKYLTSLKKEEKWTLSKCVLPKYDVKLKNEDNIISGVPAKCLHRLECPPNKKIVQYFIRNYALRIGTGEDAHWVVEDELVKRYSLPSKFSVFILDPEKSITHNSPSVTSTKKRRALTPPGKNPASTFEGSKKEELNREIKKQKKTSQDVKYVGFPYKHVSFQLPKKCLLPEAFPRKKKMKLQKARELIMPMSGKLTTPKKEMENPKTKKTITLDLCSSSPVVEKKHEKIVQKQKLVSMTEDEGNNVLRETQNEPKEKIREKAKQHTEKEIQKNWQQFEDQDLSGRNLTTFKPVKTPQELPNTLFGDVVMVVEFLNCYSQLLMPGEKYQVNAFTLMEALTVGRAGFFYLNHVLMTLLQTLLQDRVAKNYVDLGMKVSEIPLTLHSVSEMVRLCLLNSEAEDGNEDYSQGDNAEDSNDSASFHNNGMKNEFLQKLETSEYFDLTVEEKLSIMVSLCHRILSTHSVHDYVEEEQQRSAEISKEQKVMKNEATSEVKKKKGNDKQLKTEVSNKEVEEEGVNTDFKNKVEEEIDLKTNDQIDLEADDMISAVKRRRFLLMQAKTEKEEKDRQQKEILEKKAEQERVHKQKVTLEKAFYENLAKAKLVLRRSPIGTDRNHDRYWLFSNGVPGLFIERGWIHDSINYTCSMSPKEFNTVERDQDPEDNMQIDGEGSTVVTTASPAATETTVPVQQNNLWLICDTQKQLDELLDCLHHQGIRESELKECLQKRYQDIVHSIHLAHKPNPILKHCDGQREHLNHLCTDIIEVAKRLYKAGLGYLDEITKLETRVHSVDNLKDFGDILITLLASVGKRFRQGFFAPKQTSQCEDSIVKTQRLDGKKGLTEEAKVSSKVEKWKDAIRNAKTFSRMHVLLGMLDVCIKWEMSSENARCKVYSRKGEDDHLILCDKCNKAFQLFCLRPKLYEIPEGEYLCPACQPSTARHSTRNRNYPKDSTEVEDEDDEEYSEDDDDNNDNVVKEYKVENDDYPHLMELQVSSKKTPKAQKIRASNVRCTEQPPMKKSKILIAKGSPYLTPPVIVSDTDELVNQSKGTHPQNLQLQLCQDILHKLIDYEFSGPFREPLNFEQKKVYTELDINPMDFLIMLSKCTCNLYHTVDEFLEDINLVFRYAELYSHNRSHVSTCLENTVNYLVAMLQEHLPDHTYQRHKNRSDLPNMWLH